jgi:hypothetical protein
METSRIKGELMAKKTKIDPTDIEVVSTKALSAVNMLKYVLNECSVSAARAKHIVDHLGLLLVIEAIANLKGVNAITTTDLFNVIPRSACEIHLKPMHYQSLIRYDGVNIEPMFAPGLYTEVQIAIKE